MALGALFCAGGCSVVTFAPKSQGSVVINEVVSSNKRSLVDEVLGSPDWIELYNGTAEPVNLSGYGLSDNMRNLHKYIFPDVTVQPGGYLIVYAADENEAADDGKLRAGFGLSKSGDFLFLTDQYFNLIQQIELPQLITDVSYARRDKGGYGFCSKPTPGAANAEEIFDSLNELFADQDLTKLVISEVLPKNRGAYPWVELYNSGNTDLRTENYYLSDTEGNPLRWQLPERTLAPGHYLLIYCSGLDQEDGELHADFKLGSADSVVTLTDILGREVSRLSWSPDIHEGLSVTAGAGQLYCAYPTPGAINSADVFSPVAGAAMDNSDPLRISEALRNNRRSITDADGDRPEWVELHNFSASPVSLHGYFLSDNAENLYKWALPDQEIPAGGYLVVFLSGKDRTGDELHASFGIGEGENAVYLTCLNGMRTDQMIMESSLGDDVSVGRDAQGNIRFFAKPTPGYENGYGYETADAIGCFNKDGVYITEVSAAHAIKTEENDWIELYNGGTGVADLSGWYLSDNPDEPERYRLDGVFIEPGAYAVVEASSHPTRQESGVAPFGVNQAGETILLSDASGARVDEFATGAIVPGVTAGRIEGDEGTSRVYFTVATPGAANDLNSARAGYAPKPVFSETGLYQSGEVTVRITARNQNAAIYFTLDGSKPSASSHAYEQPITIKKNTILRAVTLVPGLISSEIATATYLFEEPHSLPVVSLVGRADDIEAVYSVTDRNKRVEREVFIQFFEGGGAFGTEFPAGIKAKGAGTLIYAQKSLSIHLRAGYGQSEITYPFYAKYGYPFTTFSALALRNSGQDSGDARIRDSFFSHAVMGMHIDAAMTRPVVLYINGSYYGIYDLNEDQNKDYLNTHYGVDPDSVEIIRRNETALEGSNDDFLRVRNFALYQNTANDEVFAELSEWIDVAYFTDYLIAQTYFANSDMFNQKYWRSTDGQVKWRPIYYDLDFGLSTPTRNMIGMYFKADGVASANGSLTYMDIYVGLRRNKAWRKMCAERYVELIVTQFNAERLTGILDEMAGEMEDEMPRHIKRWRTIKSVSGWNNAVKQLRNNLEKRPKYALQHVKSYFGLSQDELDELVKKYGG